MTPSGTTLFLVLLSTFFCSTPHGLAGPVALDPPLPLQLNEPQPTRIIVRVVAHGSMVLGREVGGARVTITDVASGEVLATGIQHGEAGDQNLPEATELHALASRLAAIVDGAFPIYPSILRSLPAAV